MRHARYFWCGSCRPHNNRSPIDDGRRLSGQKSAHDKMTQLVHPFHMSRDNDYTNHYITTGEQPVSFVTNIEAPLAGYPKLEQLHQLKTDQINTHATPAFGCRVETASINATLEKWVGGGVRFDVVMVGALVEGQFVPSFLRLLPLAKILAKPGYFFIWATTPQIRELSEVLNSPNFAGKFRRSEELVFMPINPQSTFHPGGDGWDNVHSVGREPLLQQTHWHCWMCITGTVRRRDHGQLIHCNVDTDLQLDLSIGSGCVPDAIYRVAENFSNSTRRLHIVPTRVGYNHYIKMRRGWVLMGPDVPIDNFTPAKYLASVKSASVVKDLPATAGSGKQTHYLVPTTVEIDNLRPKTPPRR
ncbi:karyogamy protein Kar4p [Diutina catenulata]